MWVDGGGGGRSSPCDRWIVDIKGITIITSTVNRTVEQDNRHESGLDVVRQGAPECEKAYFKPKHVYLNLSRQSERATSETDLIFSKDLTF